MKSVIGTKTSGFAPRGNGKPHPILNRSYRYKEIIIKKLGEGIF